MKTQTIPHKYQFKRGRSGAFDGSTLLLEAGEPFIEYREDKTIAGMKIGDGVNYYDKLPFLDEKTQELLSALIEEVKVLRNEVNDAGDSSYIVPSSEWDSYPLTDINERITQLLALKYEDVVPTLGNLFVVKGEINGCKANNYQVFVLTADGWEQIVGKTFSANDIVFTDNIKFTEPVGALDVPDNGHGYINCKGKSLSDLLSTILCTVRAPMITNPTVEFDVQGMNDAPVGDTASITYTIGLLDSGSYQFGPETGAQFKQILVTLKNNGKSVKTSSDSIGKFEVTLKEGDLYTIEASVTISMKNIPKDNMGNQSVRVPDVTYTLKHNKELAAYSPTVYIYGYRTNDNAFNLSTVSGETLANELTNKSTRPTTISCRKMKQLIIALPKSDNISEIAVTNAATNFGQKVSSFEVDIPVNDQEVRYIVFYVENVNADTADNKYKINYIE